jgi:hypothetical protein
VSVSEFYTLTASFDVIKDMSLESECVSWLERLVSLCRNFISF